MTAPVPQNGPATAPAATAAAPPRSAHRDGGNTSLGTFGVRLHSSTHPSPCSRFVGQVRSGADAQSGFAIPARSFRFSSHYTFRGASSWTSSMSTRSFPRPTPQPDLTAFSRLALQKRQVPAPSWHSSVFRPTSEQKGASREWYVTRHLLHARTSPPLQSDPKMIKDIINAVTIPVMAKVRIGHFVEAQVCLTRVSSVPISSFRVPI